MSIQAFTANNKGNWKANLPVLWLGVFFVLCQLYNVHSFFACISAA